MSTSSSIKLSHLGCGIALALLGSPALADVQTDYAFKTQIATVDSSGQDLGLLDNGNTTAAYLDATPWVHFQFSPAWSAFLRVRAFIPTGTVLANGNENNNVAATNQAFAGLQEAWVDYGGFTNYPGESIRVGRQRIREDDAEYWDQDVDAVRWIFDTTLLQAQVAAGREFSTYRTDDIGLPPEQAHRTYLFGVLSGEWHAYQRIGVRALYATDENSNLPPVGSTVGPESKLLTGDRGWIGVYADNHYFDGRDTPQPWSYDLSLNWLTGHQSIATVDPVTQTVTGVNSGKVNAWAAEGGLRYRFPMERFPLQLGAAYVYSGGARAGSVSDQFTQTGLQSNYSRFTGTDSLIERFTDAYRVELGNLRAATLYASVNMNRWDASVIASRYQRVHDTAPIVADNLVVNPTGPGALGNGYDIVLTRYFGGRRALPSDLLEGDNPTSSLRLRGSVFDPGPAYGPTAKREYRVSLELTLWL